jgi:dUTP pyrophosphatase
MEGFPVTHDIPAERICGVLSRETLRGLIASEPPLLQGFIDLDEQLQPNGFDLTLSEIGRHAGMGVIGTENRDRVLPDIEPLPFDADGWIDLAPGIYHITYNETVTLPNTLMALGRPRSSIARCGNSIHTAVWDAGYSGRSTSLLHVINPDGLRLRQHARVAQLVFMTLTEETNEGYSGIYQHENR